MSVVGPQSFRKLVEEFSKLPGIGERTAQRLVFHLIGTSTDEVESLAMALREMKAKLKLCSVCCALTDDVICTFCKEGSRNQALICVVEDPSDVFAIERSAQYRGLYHVLHGSLAPLDGVGPSDLKIPELLRRIKTGGIQEIILATDPDVEGEATALYLGKLLKEVNIRTSRLAMGIPMGGNLEYTDQVTLGRAIVERRAF